MKNEEMALLFSEATPYIQKYHGKTMVIKYGGNAMINETLKNAVMNDLVTLTLLGVRVVLVHGGGPAINEMLKKVGVESHFAGGLRVTDDATMNVVEMVLVGSVNKDIVSRLNRAGARAVGLSGKDGMLLEARKRELVVRRADEGEDAPPEIIDLGNVGQVTRVNTALIHSLIRDGFVPVIAPVGVDGEGRTYNINADAVAGAVAGALRAKRLLMLTDVAGLMDRTGELITDLTAARAKALQGDGTISGGMIPKVECCLSALADGVDMVTIVDGRVENCILLELLTDRGIGTALTL